MPKYVVGVRFQRLEKYEVDAPNRAAAERKARDAAEEGEECVYFGNEYINEVHVMEVLRKKAVDI